MPVGSASGNEEQNHRKTPQCDKLAGFLFGILSKKRARSAQCQGVEAYDRFLIQFNALDHTHPEEALRLSMARINEAVQ
jgi:hypothetical protein